MEKVNGKVFEGFKILVAKLTIESRLKDLTKDLFDANNEETIEHIREQLNQVCDVAKKIVLVDEKFFEQVKTDDEAIGLFREVADYVDDLDEELEREDN